MSERTAVVTALGVLSPLGRGPEATWEAALTGRSGVTRAPDGRLVAQVCGPDAPGPVRDADGRPLIGRATALATTAGSEALTGVDPATVDLVVGTTMGEPSWIDTWPSDEAAQAPVAVARSRELLGGTPEGLAAAVADALGVGGRVAAVGGACAAGNFALARALDDVRSGRSSRVLAGGVDAFSRTALMGFARLGALAEDGCRPFGHSRQGLVLGEGAAFLLVEELSAAQSRGAEPLAVLAGAGLSCDAHHPTSPHPEGAGAARAVLAALSDAGVRPDDVGWVSAHGTGTPANDRAEVLALRTVFTGRRPPASSVKSLSGHGLGAASAIEAVLAVQALGSGCLPPTWNVGEQDPDCDWDVVTDGPRSLERDVVLNQAYAFGGCNAVTVFKARVVTAYVTAAAVFGPSGFTPCGLGPPGLVSDSLLAASLTLRGLRPLSRTARLAMVAAAAVWPPSLDARDAVVLGSARSSVAPLAEFVQVAAEHGPDQVFPMAFPNTVVSVHVGYVATLLGITGPAVAVCGEHAGLEAVVEALSLISSGRADRALAIGADAAEPTVRSGFPDAAEGSAAVRLAAVREPTCLAEVTGCWTAATYDDLPPDVRPADPALSADSFGAASGAARVAVAALAVSSDRRPRIVVGPSGVRGVAAVRLERVDG